VDALCLGADVKGFRPFGGDAPAHFDGLDAIRGFHQDGDALGGAYIVAWRKGEDVNQSGNDQFGLFRREGVTRANACKLGRGRGSVNKPVCGPLRHVRAAPSTMLPTGGVFAGLGGVHMFWADIRL
jgi:hypothetical protein